MILTHHKIDVHPYFLGHYRRFAKVAAKRKAAGPRATQSRYEQLGRDLAAAEESARPRTPQPRRVRAR